MKTHADMTQPEFVHICDGSEEEFNYLLGILQGSGQIRPLHKYENKYVYILEIYGVFLSQSVLCFVHHLAFNNNWILLNFENYLY